MNLPDQSPGSIKFFWVNTQKVPVVVTISLRRFVLQNQKYLSTYCEILHLLDHRSVLASMVTRH